MERNHRVGRSANVGRKERNVKVVACSICGNGDLSTRRLHNYCESEKEAAINCSS
ncbi:predicted protein [Botrytis cinerea T4]|uniref:Uncharacterized protein n=1 Tax=Botryotinia fuckeliana (strain T4) TaxID=999810 RepID=G2XZF5_BOTF4|nr:predicted protein [Botrytis cinerea T4]